MGFLEEFFLHDGVYSTFASGVGMKFRILGSKLSVGAVGNAKI
jgi:hypothetical protein